MLKVSEFLDKSKACAGIDSDYRLAKVIGITHSAITNYRGDKSLPDEKVIQKLCEFTGDDPDVISSLFQSRRARTEEGRQLWLRVAQRLANSIIIPKEKAPELDAAGGLDTWRKRRDSNPR